MDLLPDLQQLPFKGALLTWGTKLVVALLIFVIGRRIAIWVTRPSLSDPRG